MPQTPRFKSQHSNPVAADHRPVVLLTGFGPFPGMPENVTGQIVGAVARQARKEFPVHQFHIRTLATEWRAAPKRVDALFRKYQPVLALHFGVAQGADGFRLETQGLNVCRPAEDAAGCMPRAAELVAEGADAYAATLPVKAIALRLRSKGYPVSISDDAGGYLCNAVLYHALHTVAATGCPCKVGFVHIPPDLSGPPLTFDAAVAGSLEIVRCMLE
jgi:pyroglutamyl-peptidase